MIDQVAGKVTMDRDPAGTKATVTFLISSSSKPPRELGVLLSAA
jgi:hypothetical protein